MTEKDLECYDLRSLLDLYMKEAKDFSKALEEGASWQALQERRVQLRRLNTVISKKYNDLYTPQRLRDKPPHGD